MARICHLFLLLLSCIVAAEKLEIKAQSFTINNIINLAELDGEVFIKKGEDMLWADKVVIKMDKKRKPLEYTATGNVRFLAHQQEREINGSAQKIIYDTQNDEYRLYNNAKITEKGEKNAITGDYITFNTKKGQAQSQGTHNRPTTLIFMLDENQKDNKQ